MMRRSLDRLPIHRIRVLLRFRASTRLEIAVSADQKLFVGRQPILDRDQSVVAYELLFRASADAQGAVFEEQMTASVRVIANTFTTMGIDAVLGDCRGFFNVTRNGILCRARRLSLR